MTRKQMIDEISKAFNECRTSFERTHIHMTVGELLDFLECWIQYEEEIKTIENLS
jgi:hypothetical protein